MCVCTFMIKYPVLASFGVLAMAVLLSPPCLVFPQVQYKPYGTPGPLKDLSGDALHKQIDTWVKNGTIEMSCGFACNKHGVVRSKMPTDVSLSEDVDNLK